MRMHRAARPRPWLHGVVLGLLVGILLPGSLPASTAGHSGSSTSPARVAPVAAPRTGSTAATSLVHRSESAGRLVGSASAIDTWVNHTGAVAPTKRTAAALAYDPTLGEVVLFGGYDPAVFADGDTWTYSAGRWTDLTGSLSTAPPARWGASLVWDPVDQELVLFGGRNDAQFLNDTWTFTDSGWQQLHPSTAPSPRKTGMIFDAAEGHVVLFGGGIGNVPAGSGSPWIAYNDTWSFLGGIWTNITPMVSPPAPVGQGPGGGILEYDAADGYAISPEYSSPSSGELWQYARGLWSRIPVAGAPPAPEYSTVGVWDDAAQMVLLFGGSVGGNTLLNYTWAYREGTWANLTPALASIPPPRDSMALADDPADGGVLMFGGDTAAPDYSYRNDTWLFVGSPWPSLAPATVPASPEADARTQLLAQPTGGLPPYLISWNVSGVGTLTGDGGVVAFPAGGPYSVEVLLVDRIGERTESSVNVSVAPRLQASITMDRPTVDVGVPLALRINASSGVPPYRANWSFPNGPAANGLFVNRSFSAVGPTAIDAVVQDADGVVLNITAEATVNLALQVSLTQSQAPDPGCGAPATLGFVAGVEGGTGPYHYNWSTDLVPAGTDAASYGPRIATTGPHLVVVQVTDAGGGSAANESTFVLVGCSSSAGVSTTLLAGIVGVAAAGAAAAGILLWRRRRSAQPPPGSS